VIRQLVRLASWTIGWTVFQWWAVIGWPDTLEGMRAALLVASMGSTLALVGYYGVRSQAFPPRSEGGVVHDDAGRSR